MSLLTAHIYVDGAGYQGEDPDATYPSPGPQAGGLHTYTGEEVNKLRFGYQPIPIEGNRNLASHVQRILNRIKDGHLEAESIRIIIRPGEEQTSRGGTDRSHATSPRRS